MAYDPYRYASDDGNTYQIVLPSEFATALNYQPSLGTEPFIPSYILPRFATFQSGPEPLWVSAIITEPFSPLAPPQSIEVGGKVYFRKSMIGEVRSGISNPGVMTVSGPQGPRGDTGATGAPGTNADLITVSGELTSSQLKNIASSPVVAVAAPGSGKVISVVQVAARYVYGGTAYGGTGNLLLDENGQNSTVFTLAQMQGTADAYAWNAAGVSQNTVDPRNQPLRFTSATNYTTGNGTVKWNIDYRIVDWS